MPEMAPAVPSTSRAEGTPRCSAQVSAPLEPQPGSEGAGGFVGAPYASPEICDIFCRTVSPSVCGACGTCSLVRGTKRMIRRAGGDMGMKGDRRGWSLGAGLLDSKPTFCLRPMESQRLL